MRGLPLMGYRHQISGSTQAASASPPSYWSGTVRLLTLAWSPGNARLRSRRRRRAAARWRAVAI